MKDDLLEKLKDFDFLEATVCLWVYKVSKNKKDNNAPSFNGHWIRIGEQLKDELKAVIANEVERVTEIHDYSLLAQNNECSALHVPFELTHAGLLVDSCAVEDESRKAKRIQQLNNSEFYVIKYVKNGEIVYGVRKTPDSWKTKKKKGFISLSYNEEIMELRNDESFEMAKSFDFIIFGDHILALHDKNKFESVLRYKQAHMENFAELNAQPDFSDLFTDTEAISKYVGNNKMQLRRAAAIRQKGYYKDPDFIVSLKDNLGRLRLNINFDENGKIKPCDKTCQDIFKALLNHRLLSHYKDQPFDVQDAVDVG